jgi:hypothetical protein
MKIFKYSRYSFLNETELLKEGSEFMQYQFGIEPMNTAGGGGNYQFATDPRMSQGNYQDSPYTDFYARQSGLVANLNQITKNLQSQTDLIYKDSNPFLEDINLFKNLKILRMFENNNLKLDVFISFKYDEEEYFGAFRNFNGLVRPKFESELFYEPEYQYRFNGDYKIKLGNFFYKKLEKWFIPEKGFYKNMKNENRVKDNMGKLFEMNTDQVVEVLGYNMSADNKPYVIIKVHDKTYHVENNDYFYFKWRFEKLNEVLTTESMKEKEVKIHLTYGKRQSVRKVRVLSIDHENELVHVVDINGELSGKKSDIPMKKFLKDYYR